MQPPPRYDATVVDVFFFFFFPLLSPGPTEQRREEEEARNRPGLAGPNMTAFWAPAPLSFLSRVCYGQGMRWKLVMASSSSCSSTGRFFFWVYRRTGMLNWVVSGAADHHHQHHPGPTDCVFTDRQRASPPPPRFSHPRLDDDEKGEDATCGQGRKGGNAAALAGPAAASDAGRGFGADGRRALGLGGGGGGLAVRIPGEPCCPPSSPVHRWAGGGPVSRSAAAVLLPSPRLARFSGPEGPSMGWERTGGWGISSTSANRACGFR